MPNPVTGLVAGGTLLAGGLIQSDAAGRASSAQSEAAAAGIAEERRQFDIIRELLKPYVDIGQPALQRQSALAGIDGYAAQQGVISDIESSPLFQSLVKQGENAILQQASATGGLRGGNVQAVLSQFRPQMLQSQIDQTYSRLGGLTSLGQQSAAGVGASGQAMGNNIANLLAQQGAAQAGGIIGQGKAMSGILSGITQGLGTSYGLTGKSLI